MDIRFSSETFQKLRDRANEENTTIPILVKSIINDILANEENNESKKTDSNLR